MAIRKFEYVLETMSNVLLKWEVGSTSGIGGFKIYKSYENNFFVEIANIRLGSPGELYTYRDTDVAAKQTYYYKVKVYDLSSQMNEVEESQTVQVKIANIIVNGSVVERGSNAPFGLTNIYIENVATGEVETIKTDEYGNYSHPTLYGRYRFYINDIPGYDIAEETLRLDADTLRYRSAYKFPKKAYRENIADAWGVNKKVLGDLDTDTKDLPRVFRTSRKHFADKFGSRPDILIGNNEDFDNGTVSFVVEGTGSKMVDTDPENGFVVFSKPPKEYLHKTVTLADVPEGRNRIVVEDASNLKSGNFLRVGLSSSNYYKIDRIDYNQNLIFTAKPLPSISTGTEISPAILLTYYYMEFPEVLSVAVNFYLIKTVTKKYLDDMRTLLPPSFWNLNIQDTNFHTVLQLYAEELAKMEEDAERVQWKNYLYDELRRDTEFKPPANVGVAPFYEVDRE